MIRPLNIASDKAKEDALKKRNAKIDNKNNDKSKNKKTNSK